MTNSAGIANSSLNLLPPASGGHIDRSAETEDGNVPRSPFPVEFTAEPIEVEGMRKRPSGVIAAAAADEELQTWNVGGRGDPHHVSNRASYHPGTRVRVDASLRLARGVLRSKRMALSRRINAGLRNHGYWPFRNCFETVAKEQMDPGGRSEIRLTVGSNGSVLHARLRKHDLKHREIALCQVQAVRQLQLDPTGMRLLEVDLAIGVWPGDVPLLALPKPSTQPAGFGPASLAPALATIDKQVARCLQEARRRDPKLWGRLALSFAIDAQGHPTEVREYQSQFGDPTAVDCVARELETVTLVAAKPTPTRLLVAWRLLRPVQPSTESPPQDAAPNSDPGPAATPSH